MELNRIIRPLFELEQLVIEAGESISPMQYVCAYAGKNDTGKRWQKKSFHRGTPIKLVICLTGNDDAGKMCLPAFDSAMITRRYHAGKKLPLKGNKSLPPSRQGIYSYALITDLTR